MTRPKSETAWYRYRRDCMIEDYRRGVPIWRIARDWNIGEGRAIELFKVWGAVKRRENGYLERA